MILSLFTLLLSGQWARRALANIQENMVKQYLPLQHFAVSIDGGGGGGDSNNHGIIDNAAIVLGVLKIFVLDNNLLYIVYCVTRECTMDD